MYKIQKAALVVLFMVLLLAIPVSAAPRDIQVSLNGQILQFDVPPQIVSGRTMVPLRAIFEALGATVGWDEQTRTITGQRGARTVVLQINNQLAWVDGGAVTLDAPAIIWAGRTLVPTRFIAESLGAEVGWNQQTRTVSVETAGGVRATSINPNHQKQILTSREVTALIQPAIVHIETHRGQGSGFFVSSEGLVLTNAHVARGSRQIIVTTAAGQRFPASVLKINNVTDLALLRVDVAPGSSFPIIKHKAYIDSVYVGEGVLAFGGPLGLVGTVTSGIVSAKRESSPSFEAWEPDVLVIQHNAAIAPGSSGGPLVNLYGEWTGVNTMGIFGLGFNFAVPADHYYWLAKQENYSLRDDWFSYYTEEYDWREEWAKIVPIINEAMAAPWGQRKIDLLNRSIPMLQALREKAAYYQPLYPEIQTLHRLWLNRLDTRLAYDLLLLDAQTNRALWSQRSQSTADIMTRAHEAYTAEWRRINALLP